MDGGPNFDAQAVIDAMGPLIGIDIAPDDRDGIGDYLRVMADFAALLFAFPLDGRDEPAPAFEA